MKTIKNFLLLRVYRPVYLCFVLAAATLEGVVSQVCDRDQSAYVTDVNAVRVRDLEQTLSQELGGSVGDLTVPLHLAEPQAPVSVGKTRRHDTPSPPSSLTFTSIVSHLDLPSFVSPSPPLSLTMTFIISHLDLHHLSP